MPGLWGFDGGADGVPVDRGSLSGQGPPVPSLSLSLLNDTSPMMHLNVMMHLRMLQCRMALAQDWTKA